MLISFHFHPTSSGKWTKKLWWWIYSETWSFNYNLWFYYDCL